MERHSLGGKEETHIIFEGSIPSHLGKLSKKEQKSSLTTLKNIATSAVPPDGHIYENIKNIDILKFSKGGRIYSKIITYIPEHNSQYHIVYILYIDEDHDYDQGMITKYSARAEGKLHEITALDNISDIEEYLSENESVDEDRIKEMVERN